MPTPSQLPIDLQRVDRGGVAVVRELGHERPADLAARGERLAEAGERPLQRDRVRLARQRRARRDRLQAAAVRTVAVAARPVGLHDHVAELGPGALAAALQRAADDEPAADPRADRQQRRLLRPARRAEAPLREHRRVGVVVDEDRQPDALGDEIAERHVDDRQVRRHHGDAALAVDQAGDPDADRVDAARPALDRVADLQTAETTVSITAAWSGARAGRVARWWTFNAGSTAPARSFVPPRSTPITQPVATIGHHTGLNAATRGP